MRIKIHKGDASPLFGLFGLMLVFSPLFGPSEAYIFSQYHQMEGVLYISRIAMLVCFALSCSLFFCFDKLSRKARSALFLGCVILTAASMVFVSLPALGATEGFLVAGAVLRGLGCGVPTLVWIYQLTKLRGNDIGVALSGSLLFYGLACTIIAMVANNSPVLAIVLLVACPLASGVGLVLVERKTPAPAADLHNQEPLPSSWRTLFVLGNFVYGFVFGVLLNCMRAMESSFVSLEFTLAAAILLVVFLLYGHATDYARGMRIYSIVSAFLLLVCTLADSTMPYATPYFISLLWAGQIFFSKLVFIDTEFSVPGFSRGSGGVALGTVALGILVAASLPFCQPASIDLTTIVAAIFCCIVFLDALFLPSKRRENSLFGFAACTLTESEEAFLTRRCEEISDQFKLTKRESEVAQLLARGYHTDVISEQLFISPLTTKTHLRNIYAKTDAHSQSEFIDLLYEGEEVSARPES